MPTYDVPTEGVEVCALTRKGNLIWGTVVSVDTSDDFYPNFIVQWSESHSTEYPFRAWFDVVSPRTCPNCDSPNHIDCEA